MADVGLKTGRETGAEACLRSRFTLRNATMACDSSIILFYLGYGMIGRRPSDITIDE